ncbi:uncharacterized protein LOC123310086 [Coccinella septempunctata]|uniref:uncharacterized protein LOC123310086 n=1 Tax=Coccinella septempunctata TaxID=41139 RepID=UPI001D0696FF|nr:uncharacterized protein LOC123310086 [Coccinella septempunctata]
MRSIKLMFFLLVEGVFAQRNVPGKITGIPSHPHEVVLLEFTPKLEAMNIILAKEIESFDRLIKLAQNLVQNNAAISRTIASQKVKELKQGIAIGKEEAKYASGDVKMCISRQEYDIPRSVMNPSSNCYMNNTDMAAVKNKLLKLQTITKQLFPNCQKLHMDDNEKEITLFRKCLTERTDDTFRHITRIRDEFDAAFSNVMKNSLECVIEGSFETFKSIGEVMSSVKNCKNMYNYKIKKLP